MVGRDRVGTATHTVDSVIEDAAHALWAAGAVRLIGWYFKADQAARPDDERCSCAPESNRTRPAPSLVRLRSPGLRFVSAVPGTSPRGHKYAMNDTAASIGLANLELYPRLSKTKPGKQLPAYTRA